MANELISPGERKNQKSIHKKAENIKFIVLNQNLLGIIWERYRLTFDGKGSKTLGGMKPGPTPLTDDPRY